MHEELLRQVYGAFNAGNSDAALALMQPSVEWAAGVDGGFVRGQAGVRQLWAKQRQQADTRIELLGFRQAAEATIVEVRQVSRPRTTGVVTEQELQHVVRVRAGLIQSVELRSVVDGYARPA